MLSVGRLLLVTGLILLVAGALVLLLGGMGLGKLPGDFIIRRGGFTLYFPLMTSILISLVISLLLWLFRRG